MRTADRKRFYLRERERHLAARRDRLLREAKTKVGQAKLFEKRAQGYLLDADTTPDDEIESRALATYDAIRCRNIADVHWFGVVARVLHAWLT